MDKSLMAKAADSAVTVARNVTPDQFDLPTPCPGWTVRDLANHLTLWSAKVSERSARRLPPPGDGSEDESNDFTAGWPAPFVEGVARAVEAWDAPGALEGETVMMADARPAKFIHDMVFGELVLHAWDLAVATGQPFEVAPEVAEYTLEGAAGMAEMARQYEVFGAEVSVPADAPPLARALGVSGRDPGWRP
ncbi:TIGR03086 family metal-binding protein [Actinokineospora sp. NBRC 105648]|uniref:TIGR03086 family metal-binding protein n=1 Tax=Actinokineospora sp. NBRC 105648 TaxID=3032206 RepID=UPI0024A4E934|nr:TIGR03086 family metal-binding protein [Actinokineospora sp. NBRC 105648]GLZ39559.1 TIGR03086 family protein [Actinokineospora sp. NBRC 105648]